MHSQHGFNRGSETTGTFSEPFPQGHGELERKDSWLGIVSFVLGILSGLGLLLIVAFVIAILDRLGPDSGSSVFMLIGMATIVVMTAALIGLGFGIAGLCQSNRKKVFAILGTVFSLLAFLIPSGMMVLAMIVG